MTLFWSRRLNFGEKVTHHPAFSSNFFSTFWVRLAFEGRDDGEHDPDAWNHWPSHTFGASHAPRLTTMAAMMMSAAALNHAAGPSNPRVVSSKRSVAPARFGSSGFRRPHRAVQTQVSLRATARKGRERERKGAAPSASGATLPHVSLLSFDRNRPYDSH